MKGAFTRGVVIGTVIKMLFFLCVFTVYKLPYVNRCWYVLSLGSEEEEEEEEDKHDEKEEDKEYEEEEMEFDEGTMFVEYGLVLLGFCINCVAV